MQVGDQRYSYGTAKDNLYPGIVINISLTADVLAKEFIVLEFDRLEAFKVRSQLRLWNADYDEIDTSYSWVVPYLGEVKYQDDTSQEILSNFSIAGGSITEMTDFDIDGLKPVFSKRRCSRACLPRSRNHLASRYHFRRAWAGRRNMRNWCSRFARMSCLMVRSSGSMARSVWHQNKMVANKIVASHG